MTARMLYIGDVMPCRDANGRARPAVLKIYLPVSGGVPTTVYTDMDLTVPHAWPIVSDNDGRFAPIWADEETYFDVVCLDLNTGAQILSITNIRPLSDAFEASATAATAAAEDAIAAAAEAAATAVEIAATIAGLGDFSDAVTAAEAAAAAAALDAAAADASADAAAASAAGINTNLLTGWAIAAASLL